MENVLRRELMSQPAKPRRQNRTITVDFNDEQTYHRLCDDGPRFIDLVAAFILSIVEILQYRQKRNHAAYLSHRKRRLDKLKQFYEVSL